MSLLTTSRWFRRSTIGGALLAIGMLVAGASTPAQAQYYPYYAYPGYAPYCNPYYDPYGCGGAYAYPYYGYGYGYPYYGYGAAAFGLGFGFHRFGGFRGGFHGGGFHGGGFRGGGGFHGGGGHHR
jgi:uncharacterized membrane protein YgcG